MWDVINITMIFNFLSLYWLNRKSKCLEAGRGWIIWNMIKLNPVKWSGCLFINCLVPWKLHISSRWDCSVPECTVLEGRSFGIKENPWNHSSWSSSSSSSNLWLWEFLPSFNWGIILGTWSAAHSHSPFHHVMWGLLPCPLLGAVSENYSETSSGS